MLARGTSRLGIWYSGDWILDKGITITLTRNVSSVAPILFSFTNIRRLSTQIDKSTSTSTTSLLPVVKKRNTKIIQLDPDDYAHTGVGSKRPSLMFRRGEPTSMADALNWRASDHPGQMTDDLTKMQTEIDIRPSAIKRILASIQAERDIMDQSYNMERVAVLGRDLGAAHFIVARHGRIRFMGDTDWISTYSRKPDQLEDIEDLPTAVTTIDNCTLPVRYDPNYRVEAMDATGMQIRYEGLMNFGGLNYLKWVSFRDNKQFNDWCLDRIYCNHGETLEYLDISGCPGISLCGLSSINRLPKLKTLVVKNLPHIKDLEILCAILEDSNPNLTCVGVDFEKKLQEIRKESAELEERIKKEAAELEANTVEIVPQEDNLDSKSRKPNL